MTAGTQEPAGFWIMYPVMSSLITCLLTDLQQVASFSPADTTNTPSHLISLSLSLARSVFILCSLSLCPYLWGLIGPELPEPPPVPSSG